MSSWVRQRASALADRAWNEEGPTLDDSLEAALRETIEEAARRAGEGGTVALAKARIRAMLVDDPQAKERP